MVPPHNDEAERTVLGAMMLNRQCALASQKFNKDDFYNMKHQVVLEAIQDLVAMGEPVDIVTVSNHLSQQERLFNAGGGAYITTLAGSVVSVANFDYHAGIVKDYAFKRQAILKGSEMLKAAYQGTTEELKQKIHDINMTGIEGQERTYETMKNLMLEVHEDIEDRYKNKGKKIGVQTGFTDLDKMIVGMEPGDNIVVAARPSMGKTAFALNIADHVARTRKGPCVFFSLEMERKQLMHRLLAKNALVNLYKIRTGEISSEEWIKITQAASIMSRANLVVDDSPGLTVVDMEYKLNQITSEYGQPSLVLIDYLQFVSPPRKGMTEFEAVTENSRAIKNLAKKFKVPIVLLSQLSRAPEARNNKRPMLSDLRQSGSIEQDADVVIFLYRDEYYNPDTDKQGITEILIEKQRNGPTGTVELIWDGGHQLFLPLSKRQEGY